MKKALGFILGTVMVCQCVCGMNRIEEIEKNSDSVVSRNDWINLFHAWGDFVDLQKIEFDGSDSKVMVPIKQEIFSSIQQQRSEKFFETFLETTFKEFLEQKKCEAKVIVPIKQEIFSNIPHYGRFFWQFKKILEQKKCIVIFAEEHKERVVSNVYDLENLVVLYDERIDAKERRKATYWLVVCGGILVVYAVIFGGLLFMCFCDCLCDNDGIRNRIGWFCRKLCELQGNVPAFCKNSTKDPAEALIKHIRKQN